LRTTTTTSAYALPVIVSLTRSTGRTYNHLDH
jgi:hypothetical protein